MPNRERLACPSCGEILTDDPILFTVVEELYFNIYSDSYDSTSWETGVMFDSAFLHIICEYCGHEFHDFDYVDPDPNTIGFIERTSTIENSYNYVTENEDYDDEEEQEESQEEELTEETRLGCPDCNEILDNHYSNFAATYLSYSYIYDDGYGGWEVDGEYGSEFDHIYCNNCGLEFQEFEEYTVLVDENDDIVEIIVP